MECIWPSLLAQIFVLPQEQPAKVPEIWLFLDQASSQHHSWLTKDRREERNGKKPLKTSLRCILVPHAIDFWPNTPPKYARCPHFCDTGSLSFSFSAKVQLFTDRQTARQPDSQTARQPNSQPDRQTARQPDSQPARHIYIILHICEMRLWIWSQDKSNHQNWSTAWASSFPIFPLQGSRNSAHDLGWKASHAWEQRLQSAYELTFESSHFLGFFSFTMSADVLAISVNNWTCVSS